MLWNYEVWEEQNVWEEQEEVKLIVWFHEYMDTMGKRYRVGYELGSISSNAICEEY